MTYIYNYSKTTKEYLYSQEAEANPAETKLKGEFVPLVPANATLIEPPVYGANEIPVFENGEWVVKADYRKNYKKVDDDLNVSDITEIGELEEGYYLVDNETAELIKQNPDKYKIEDSEVVQKTEEEIALENEQKEKERINNLTMTALDFITGLTTLGLTLETINSYLEANLELKMQLTYCNNVYCYVVKSLCPLTVGDFTLTEEITEAMFLYKAGEISTDDLTALISTGGGDE